MKWEALKMSKDPAEILAEVRKKLENLRAALALHFAHYNFIRVHSTLRVTPAMAAGITSTIWNVGAFI